MKPMPNSIEIGTLVRHTLGSEGEIQNIILTPSPTGGIVLFTVNVTKTAEGPREPFQMTSPASEWARVGENGEVTTTVSQGHNHEKNGEVCTSCNQVHDRSLFTPEMVEMVADFRRTSDEETRTSILAELADRFADNLDETMVDVPQWVHKAVLQWRSALEKGHNKTMHLGRIVLASIETSEGRKATVQQIRQTFAMGKPPKDDKPLN